MILNQSGQIAAQCWLDIPHHFSTIELDAYVIMPNHMHGILVLTDGVGTRYSASDKPPSLGRVINVYKGAVTRQIRCVPQTHQSGRDATMTISSAMKTA